MQTVYRAKKRLCSREAAHFTVNIGNIVTAKMAASGDVPDIFSCRLALIVALFAYICTIMRA